jgi:hypothetical protein
MLYSYFYSIPWRDDAQAHSFYGSFITKWRQRHVADYGEMWIGISMNYQTRPKVFSRTAVTRGCKKYIFLRGLTPHDISLSNLKYEVKIGRRGWVILFKLKKFSFQFILWS